MTPEPTDKLDATTHVAVNGPADETLRSTSGSYGAHANGPATACLSPDAVKVARRVCARHDQQLGGASPLWRLMAPTTSRWQPLSREAGWGGSRSAKSRP